MNRCLTILALVIIAHLPAFCQSSTEINIGESSSILELADISSTASDEQESTKGWLKIADRKLSGAQCHIFDEKGLMLYSSFLDDSNMLWVGDLPVGKYSIKVSDGKKTDLSISFDKKY